MALTLAGAGAIVGLVSRDREKLQSVAGEIEAAGGKAHVFVADVASETQVIALAKEVATSFPRVDILINNAGMNIRKKITDFTLEEWNRVLDTNLTSVFLMCRSFVPQMRGAGFGHHQHDVDHEPYLTRRARRLFVQQDGAARFNADTGPGTCAGRNHGKRHQPGAVRNRDEYAAHAESRD